MKNFLLFLAAILIVRLVFFYLYPPQVQTISKNPVKETSIFADMKAHMRDAYGQNLNAREAGLLMGIVFGDKEVDRESNLAFQKTGVLHVIAASGMNVSMVTSFLLALLLVLFKRQYALVLTLVAVLFYTALADFQPSIVRAAIMAAFALGAGVLGRQNTSLLALFFAAFAMIFWDPAVLTSISFLLSFAATLGIIILDPVFKTTILAGSFFSDFRTTLSAQIATTPIILFFFGAYSPVSIPVNFLVLWTVPPLMAFGGMGAILSFISPVLAAPFILLCLPLLLYFRGIVDLSLPYSFSLHTQSVPWTLIIGYYMILSGAVVRIYQLRKTK